MEMLTQSIRYAGSVFITNNSKYKLPWQCILVLYTIVPLTFSYQPYSATILKPTVN